MLLERERTLSGESGRSRIAERIPTALPRRVRGAVWIVCLDTWSYAELQLNYIDVPGTMIVPDTFEVPEGTLKY